MKRRYLRSYELFQPKEGFNFGHVRTHIYTFEKCGDNGHTMKNN